MSHEPAIASSKQKTKRIPTHSVIAERIRAGILANELAPGQRLVEAELCEQFEANRRTIRAALADLDHEGLVERIANRGARVRVVSFDEALEISEVRNAVETLCVRRAAERVSTTDSTELRTLAAELAARVAANDVDGFAALTDQIFRSYVRMAQHPVAEEVLERLRGQSARHGFRLRNKAGWITQALPEWQAIVDAICSGDPEAAEAALRHHANAWQDATRALAKDNPFSAFHRSR